MDMDASWTLGADPSGMTRSTPRADCCAEAPWGVGGGRGATLRPGAGSPYPPPRRRGHGPLCGGPPQTAALAMPCRPWPEYH